MDEGRCLRDEKRTRWSVSVPPRRGPRLDVLPYADVPDVHELVKPSGGEQMAV